MDSSFEKVLEIANNVEYTKQQYNLVHEIKEEDLNFIRKNKGGQQKHKISAEQCKYVSTPIIGVTTVSLKITNAIIVSKEGI